MFILLSLSKIGDVPDRNDLERVGNDCANRTSEGSDETLFSVGEVG